MKPFQLLPYGTNFRLQPAFWIVTGIHLFWAALLCISVEPLHTTPLAAMTQVFGGSRWLVAVALVASAALAWGSLYDKKGNHIWMRMPQLALVGLTVFGDLRCIWRGQYADLVPRPIEFIAADQISFILIAVAYVFTVRRRAA